MSLADVQANQIIGFYDRLKFFLHYSLKAVVGML